MIMSSKYNYPSPARELSAQDAVTNIINTAGAYLPVRDSVDARLVTELKSYGKTGQLISDETVSPMNGPGTVAGGTKPTDTDGDGIPDAAESALGTNPKVNDSTADKNGNGYINVEDWANSLVPSAY